MAKKVKANLKLRIPAGKASAGPPVGSTLGQYGLNMMDFINPFNEQTKDMMGSDVIVHLQIFEDRSFTFDVIGEPADDLIRKAAGIKKGSGVPHKEKVGKLTDAQLTEIAETKMKYLNANDIDAAKKVIAGTARSMGVEIEG
jgi:large subunit ribosomal protein L11